MEAPPFSYRAAVLALAVGNVAVLSGLYVAQPVLPLFAVDFHVSAALADLTISLATFGLAVALLVVGPISDRVGRKPVMLAASVALIAPTLGVALAPTFPLLLLFRMLQGVCSAGVGSIALAYVIQEFPLERVGSGLGWGTLSLVAAAVVGRVGGGILAGLWGWRAMFIALAVLDLIGVFLMFVLLPPERRFAPSGGLDEAFGALAAHARSFTLLRVGFIEFLLSFALLAYFAQLSYYLARPPFRLPTAELGLVYLVYVVGAVAPLAGALSTRIGRKPVMAGGLVLLAAGCLLSLIPWLPAVVWATAIASLGLFITHTADNAYVGDVAAENRGAATALYMFCYYVGGSAGVYLMGLVWDADGWAPVAIVCAAAAVFGLLLVPTLPVVRPAVKVPAIEAAP